MKIRFRTLWRRSLCLLLLVAMSSGVSAGGLEGADTQPVLTAPDITQKLSDLTERLDAGNGGLDAFQLPDPLPEPPFTDVSSSAWYYQYVQAQFALNLMEGTGENRFSPDRTVPLAQGVTVAVRIYEKYRGIPDGSEDFQGQTWYDYYIAQANAYGILPEGLFEASPTRPATRAELAELLYRSLPESELPAINDVQELPDYGPDDPYWTGALVLYRAGVLTGNELGTFRPDANIKRSELAAMLTRLVCPAYRVALDPEPTDPTQPPDPTDPTDPPEAPGMDAFLLPDPLPPMPFTDVAATIWYRESVQVQYALGLMEGTGRGRFSPVGTVPLTQAVAVAVRIYEKYQGIPDGSEDYGGAHWYDYYVDRGRTYGILPTGLAQGNLNRAATRAEVAEILCRSLPVAELSPVNQVERLPDYGPQDAYWSSVQRLFQAGVLTGHDAYGTFRPDTSIKRAELAAILTRLVCPSYRKQFTLQPWVVEAQVYGKSGAGRDLTAYRFGDGDNVMVVTFAIHGWEDNYNRDGEALVGTARALMEALKKQYQDLITKRNWTVYVLPCLNPDGLYDGQSHNGPGRCTTYYLDEKGNNVYGNGKGIDLNRSFPYKYRSFSSGRNFNGTAPLQAREARALADFTREVKGTGHNVLIDTHGWYQQIIVTEDQSNPIYRTLKTYFPGNRYTYMANGEGYYSAWAGFVLGYDACLFEFPSVSSQREFDSRGYGTAYVNALCQLLRTYA